MNNKFLFIFISVFLLLIGVNKVGATVIYEDSNVTLDEDFIYNAFNSIDGYSYSENKNILCNYKNSPVESYPNLTCYSMSNDFLSHLHFVTGDDRLLIRSKENLSDTLYYSFYYSIKSHSFDYLKSYSSVDTFTNFYVYNQSYSPFSYVNFDLTNIEDINSDMVSKVSSLDFSSFEEPEEPVVESLSILSYASENFNKILSKATDICSYLFTQELFLMCLSVVLFYIVFLIIFKLTR